MDTFHCFVGWKVVGYSSIVPCKSIEVVKTIKPPNQPMFDGFTTYVWWFGGCFTIVLTTLSSRKQRNSKCLAAWLHLPSSISMAMIKLHGINGVLSPHMNAILHLMGIWWLLMGRWPSPLMGKHTMQLDHGTYGFVWKWGPQIGISWFETAISGLKLLWPGLTNPVSDIPTSHIVG